MKPITPEELAQLPAKSKKDPRVVELYRQHDYESAYAMHTDMRVRENGYKAAIGNDQDWELEGEKQRQFLWRAYLGTRPMTMRLLEIGCGTGRLARKVVALLDNYCYVGVDLSPVALDAALDLAYKEGWIKRNPAFYVDLGHVPQQFDVAFAFSVFIHCPYSLMCETMQLVSWHLHKGSPFYFSYVPEKQNARTGLKQFRHTEAAYKAAVQDAGLEWTGPHPLWPGPQLMAMCVKT